MDPETPCARKGCGHPLKWHDPCSLCAGAVGPTKKSHPRSRCGGFVPPKAGAK